MKSDGFDPRLLSRRGFGADLGAQLFGLRNVDLLVEVVVDQHDGRRAAARETFDEIDRHFAVGRNFTEVRVEFLLEGGAGFVATDERAGKRAANFDVPTTDGLLPEHWVKRDHFEHVDRMELKLGRDPLAGIGRQVANVLLDEVQQRERRAALHRVMGDYLVDALEGGGLEIHQRESQEKISGRTRP